MQWVGCREGDRALGDERQAHDEVHRAGFPLLLCEPVLEKQCCKSNGTGRYHAADHDCRHDVIVACGDGCGAEDVSRLIEGAAHVDGHHAGHDDAQKDPAGTAHVGQCGVQSRVQRADGRLYQELHDQAHEEDAAQRIQKYRCDLLYGLGQFGKDLDQKQNQVARDKACRQRAQEAGFACGSHHAADEAHGQSRPVCNAHGDESGQDREHEAEGHVADAFQGGGGRRDGTESRPRFVREGVHIHAKAVDQERQRDEDAAAHHEGEHMGDAVHKLDRKSVV